MLVFRVCVCACGYAIYTVTFALPTAGKLHDVGCPPVHGEPRPTVIRKLPTSHNSKLHHISTQLCAFVAYRDYTAVDAMSIPPQPPIPPLQCLDPGLPCPSRLPPPPRSKHEREPFRRAAEVELQEGGRRVAMDISCPCVRCTWGRTGQGRFRGWTCTNRSSFRELLHLLLCVACFAAVGRLAVNFSAVCSMLDHALGRRVPSSCHHTPSS